MQLIGRNLKNWAVAACLLGSSWAAQAQIAIEEVKTKMGKTELQCFAATYNKPKGITSELLDNTFQNANVRKSARKKGFTIYRAALCNNISTNKSDYYTKVKNKKGKTIVYLCASKGYDNYVTSTNDTAMAGNITRFLQELDARIETEMAIRQKEAELQKIQKENKKLDDKLQDAKKQEEKKSDELNKMRIQKAPDPVK